MKIEILGPGCPRCEVLVANATEAATKLGLDVEVIKVTDITEITSRGVMLPPALIVDGEIKASGRVPSAEEIEAMLS